MNLSHLTPNKRIVLLILAPLCFFVLIAVWALFGPKENLASRSADKSEYWVEVKNQRFKVEVADTDAKRARGLMYRQSLNEDSGMLFIFNEQKQHAFWMLNTKIKLDMIWISSDFRVVFVYENAEPCVSRESCAPIIPDEDALYVLELNGGAVERYGVKVGDLVRFSPSLKATN